MFERIVILVGMPRSGTSWLSQIVDSSPMVRFRLSPIFSYELKNTVDEHSTLEEYETLFRKAYVSQNEFMDQTVNRRKGDYPTFTQKMADPPVLVVKMTRFHNLLRRIMVLFPNLRMVALVRHPCGAIHSWLTTSKEFPSDADPLAEWQTGACRKPGFGEFWGFDDWMKVTRLHLELQERYPDRFQVVRYEDLVDDTVGQSQAMFRFLGLDYTEPTEKFLAACHAEHRESSYAVFKSPKVKNRWKTELQKEIRDEILSRVRGTELEQFI